MVSTKRDKDRMSRKQMLEAAVRGRRVTLYLTNGYTVEGYVGGIDDYHWLVVTPTAEKYLVHKSLASAVQLSDDATYDDEPQRDKIDSVIGPFRNWAARTIGREEEQPQEPHQ